VANPFASSLERAHGLGIIASVLARAFFRPTDLPRRPVRGRETVGHALSVPHASFGGQHG
jgi:hypothetical protein